MCIRRSWQQAVSKTGVIMALVLSLVCVSETQANEVGEAVSEMVNEAMQQVESVSVEELTAMMTGEQRTRIVDIRTEAEYKAGHLRGATWIPRGKMEFAAAGGMLPSTRDKIVVYCKTDGRSSLCAAMLKRLGYENVKYLKGGFVEWVESGHTIYNMHGELTVKNFEKSEEE